MRAEPERPICPRAAVAEPHLRFEAFARPYGFSVFPCIPAKIQNICMSKNHNKLDVVPFLVY